MCWLFLLLIHQCIEVRQNHYGLSNFEVFERLGDHYFAVSVSKRLHCMNMQLNNRGLNNDRFTRDCILYEEIFVQRFYVILRNFE